MSAGGSFNPPQASGGTGDSPLTSDQPSEPVMRTADFQDSNNNGIDDRDEGQQRFAGPQIDRSFGFARQFQQPSFINPFMGGYGFGQPFGGFGSGFGGGFGNSFGGLGGSFGMGLGSLYGGYSPMPFGGYQSYQPPQQQFNYQPPRQQGPGNAYVQPLMGRPQTPSGNDDTMTIGGGGGINLWNQNQYFEPQTIGIGGSPEFERMRRESSLRQFQERQTGGGKPAPDMGGQVIPPMQSPAQSSFDSRQRNIALQQLAAKEGWSQPMYSMQLISPEQSAARDARDAEAAANFLKEKGVQYDDPKLQDFYQSLFGQQTNNAPAAPVKRDPNLQYFDSSVVGSFPAMPIGSGRDQFSINPYDQQQAQMAAMRSISPSPYLNMGGLGSFFGGGGFRY